jgi:preprotein translocase subunit SecE
VQKKVADKKAELSKADKPKLKTVYDRAKKKADAMAAQKAKHPGKKKGNAVVKYFKDMRSELKKVVWPSRKKVLNNTGVVMVAMIFCALIIWGIDSGLGALFSLMIK